jgi:leader peptidase (prepilin peptidase)/N-methyltransferase
VGVALIARHGSEARKRAVPFGPFLALGGVLGLWFGDEIVDWYLDEFFSSD